MTADDTHVMDDDIAEFATRMRRVQSASTLLGATAEPGKVVGLVERMDAASDRLHTLGLPRFLADTAVDLFAMLAGTSLRDAARRRLLATMSSGGVSDSSST